MQSEARPLLLAHGLTRDFLIHHRVCPLSWNSDGSLHIGTAPNAELDALDELALAYDATVTQSEMTDADLSRAIERLATSAESSIELARATAGDDDATADARDL